MAPSTSQKTSSLRVVGLTAIALSCFAANSLLCRLALAERQIEATTFTAIRLVSGAAVLAVLSRRRPSLPKGPGWISAAALFVYAAPFSFAYLRLGAAIGALVLFGSVQTTMIGWGLVRGERPSALGWVGILVALGGLILLTVPGRSAPDPTGAAAMTVAGIAWGVYSLRGRAATGDPVVVTSASFTRALVPAAVLVLGALGSGASLRATPRGFLLATASGAVASGLGYSIWYAALRDLTATRAAILQLLVPILAAAAAVVLLGEHPSSRLLGASAAILGGVAITIRARKP